MALAMAGPADATTVSLFTPALNSDSTDIACRVVNRDPALAAVTINLRILPGGGVGATQNFAIPTNQAAEIVFGTGNTYYCEAIAQSSQADNLRMNLSIEDGRTVSAVRGSRIGSAANGVVTSPSLLIGANEEFECIVVNTSPSNTHQVTISLITDTGVTTATNTVSIAPMDGAAVTGSSVAGNPPVRCQVTATGQTAAKQLRVSHGVIPTAFPHGPTLAAIEGE